MNPCELCEAKNKKSGCDASAPTTILASVGATVGSAVVGDRVKGEDEE